MKKNYSGPIVKEYEKTDSTFIDIFTLSPEALFFEKLSAFKNRRLSRDIYDVYHLSRQVKFNEWDAKKAVAELMSLSEPIDSGILKTLVLAGAVPDFNQMVS